MRFYAILIEDAPAAFPPMPGAFIPGAQFCSVIDGINDPSALRVQMLIQITGTFQSTPKSFVRVFGVSPTMLSSAADLSGKNIRIFGGFWEGLPLATEERPYLGLLYCGVVWAAYGNWKGLDMTLDILLNPGSAAAQKDSSASGPGSGASTSGGTIGPLSTQRLSFRQSKVGTRKSRLPLRPSTRDDSGGNPLGGIIGGLADLVQAALGFTGGGWGVNPVNIIHNQKQGQELSSAIQQTISTAFPNAQLLINVASGLITNFQDAAFHQTFDQFSGYINQASKALFTGNSDYKGIDFFLIPCNKIIAHDWLKPIGGFNVRFEELIGQPTWYAPNQIQFMTVMRPDITPPYTINLPNQTLQYVNFQPPDGSGNSPYNSGVPWVLPPSMSTNFFGSFQIFQVVHNGDSRHPSGETWSTSIWANHYGGFAPNIAAQFSAAGGVVESAVSGIIGGGATPQQLRQFHKTRYYRRVRRY